MALPGSSRRLGGSSLGVNKWKSVSVNKILGEYEYNKDSVTVYSQFNYHKHKCKCEADCGCHWEFKINDTASDCPCIDNLNECRKDCEGCIAAENNNKFSNRQIQMNGLLVKIGESYYIKEWNQRGYRLKTDQELKNGQYIGCYMGNIIPYKDRDKKNEYIFDMDYKMRIVLKNKAKDTPFPKGYIKWCIDSRDIGTDLNHVNTRCHNNNVACYPVWVNGLLHLGFYAIADIKPGMFARSHLNNTQFFLIQINRK